MTDPRDPLDETLAQGLGALAPSEFELDADHALGSLRPALRRARARRRLTVSTSVLGVFAVLAGGAVVLRHHPSSHVSIVSPVPSTVTGHGHLPSTSTSPVSIVTSPPSVPATTPTSRVEHRHLPTTTTTPVHPGVGPAVTTSTTKTTTTTTTTTTTKPPAPKTATYKSTGGRVTITFAGGQLKLDSYTATAGYSVEVHTDTASEIEVRFTNDTDHRSSRVRVRVQHGVLEPEIQNN